VGGERELGLLREHKWSDLAERWLGSPRESMEQVYSLETRAGTTHEAPQTRLIEEFSRYAVAPSSLRMFKFWNRNRRELSLIPTGLLRALEAAYCPYLDSEVISFLASIPEEMLLNGRFHEDAIRRAYPAYAHIPLSIQRPSGVFSVHLVRYVLCFVALAAKTAGSAVG